MPKFNARRSVYNSPLWWQRHSLKFRITHRRRTGHYSNPIIALSCKTFELFEQWLRRAGSVEFICRFILTAIHTSWVELQIESYVTDLFAYQFSQVLTVYCVGKIQDLVSLLTRATRFLARVVRRRYCHLNSVCPSVCHTCDPCQNGSRYRNKVCTIRYPSVYEDSSCELSWLNRPI